jgi:serine/threonine-protein kinase
MTSDARESDLEHHAKGRIGTTLRGKYRLDSVIGLGGMAVVYKATHRNQAEFAVKMLHPELSIRDDVRTRFIREGYAANSVKHPGVVLVVDDDIAEDGAAFIVMELLDGAGCETLWERFGGRLPVEAACSIGHQLLDVLASVHAKGIVHRDLKPANLFVTREGRVKVLDFGIARVRDVAASHATMTGMLLGTPAFMGPEQALGNTSEVGAQTDLWAAGATLFTLLTGSLVHEADNGQQILIKAATQRARSLSSAMKNAPKELVDVVDRSLAFDKGERWADASAMRDALAKACEAATGRAPSAAALARLVVGGEDREAAPASDHRSKTAIAETIRASVVPRAAAVRAAATVIDAPAPRAALPRSEGVATAEPVVSPVAASSKRRAFILPVAMIGAVAIALSLGNWKITGALPTSPSASTPAARSVPPPAPRSVEASPPAFAAPAPSAVAAPAPSVVAAPAPSAVASVVKPAVPKVTAAAPTTRPSSSSVVAPSASATAAPKCRMVESIDAEGQHHFKKVCD